jgi:hypothetical protein
MAKGESSIWWMIEPDAREASVVQWWAQTPSPISTGARGERNRPPAQGNRRTAKKPPSSLVVKSFRVGRSRECLKSPRLAKVDAIAAYDNQQDCGGAGLRHGANVRPLTVRVLETGQRDSGQYGSYVFVRSGSSWVADAIGRTKGSCSAVGGQHL